MGRGAYDTTGVPKPDVTAKGLLYRTASAGHPVIKDSS